MRGAFIWPRKLSSGDNSRKRQSIFGLRNREGVDQLITHQTLKEHPVYFNWATHNAMGTHGLTVFHLRWTGLTTGPQMKVSRKLLEVTPSSEGHRPSGQ
jgi:hypothetical protein